MKPFTKLFNSIVTSSIWRESNDVRIIWITMLALADKDGEVWASVGGLAHTAGIDRELTVKALKTLASPDPDSRSKEYDGRRICDIEGGWGILNYKKYRDLGRAEDRREYFAEHKRQQRARPHLSPMSTSRPPMSPIAEAEADIYPEAHAAAETRARAEKQTEPPAQPPPAADLFDGEKIQDIPPIERKTFGDFQAMHGRLYVGKGERDAWEAILATWGWDPCHEAYGACLALLKNAGHRIQLSMMTRYLDDNFVLKGTP